MLMVAEKETAAHALALATEYDESTRWYVLACEPMQEAIAAAGLIGRRFSAYCPQYPKSIRQNYHKRRTVMRPMLPGYIFTSYDGTGAQWHRIHGIPGVRRMLKANDQPVSVPEAAISFIRAKESEAMAGFGKRKRAPLTFKIGDWVQIVEHFSFTGLLGQVVGLLDAKERLTLHIDLLGRLTPVEVGAHQVRAL